MMHASRTLQRADDREVNPVDAFNSD